MQPAHEIPGPVHHGASERPDAPHDTASSAVVDAAWPAVGADRPEAVRGLEARLRTIEAAPLEARAAAYAEVHDELRGTLEGSTGSTDAGGR